MANRNVLAIGTSAGGVEALLFLAELFPAGFPAAILVTIHLPGQSRSALDELISRAGPLPAVFARHGEAVEHGRIFIAPPGRHLLIEGETLSLGTGPRENNARPAIDPMLRSVAICCGYRSVGVVLTGTMGDGASGLLAINQCGGASVVQDPSDAAFPEMPLTALNRSGPQHVVRLEEMPKLLQRLVDQPAGEPSPAPPGLKYELEVARGGEFNMDEMDRIGRRSVLACPDCHGVMWEIDEGDLVRYRCHVGHAHTEDTMTFALDDNLRRALGSALRALDERIALAEKLQRQASRRGHNQLSSHWAARKAEYEAEADIIRNAVRRADEIAVKEGAGVA
jgi:two-component system, chemotaxis family, protein-glutamate methylesterase/glutaminase